MLFIFDGFSVSCKEDSSEATVLNDAHAFIEPQTHIGVGRARSCGGLHPDTISANNAWCGKYCITLDTSTYGLLCLRRSDELLKPRVAFHYGFYFIAAFLYSST